MTQPSGEWPPDETPVDDDWDWDTDLGRDVPELPPSVWRRPPEGYLPPETMPEREPPQLELCLLQPGTVGDFLRAARAHAGLSQRALADAAALPRTTLSRLEAGQVQEVRLSTVVRLATACGVRLVGEVDAGAPAAPALLHTDRAQRHRDALGRMLPAHLVNRPVEDRAGRRSWWGLDRPALLRERPVPARTYETRVWSEEQVRELSAGWTDRPSGEVSPGSPGSRPPG